jgi:hypothetical protein
MANFLSFEKLEYYHGKLLTKINGLLNSKADKSEVNTVQGNLTTHINDTAPHITSAERTKLSNITAGAQPNQNAFSNIAVSGQDTVAAESTTDTVTFVAGSGITITTDATNDKVTITNAGVKTVATGSSNGTISVNGTNVAVKGLGSAAYTASTAYETPTNAQSKADAALASAKSYTNEKFNSIVGEGASEALDTIGEISAALQNNPDIITTLNQAIGNKVSKENGKGLSTNDYTTAEKTKLAGITAGAQPNQNAFGKVTVGSTIIEADATIDNLTLEAGTNITLTPDASGDKITITAKDTTYGLSNGTGTAGLIKTSSTVNSSNGYTACPVINGVPYYKDTNTQYTLGSFSVTATATELNVLDGITASTAELNYCDGVTSNIQEQINTANAAIVAVDNKIKEVSTDQIDTLFT